MEKITPPDHRLLGRSLEMHKGYDWRKKQLDGAGGEQLRRGGQATWARVGPLKFELLI